MSIDVNRIYVGNEWGSPTLDNPKMIETPIPRKISTIKVNSKFGDVLNEIKSAKLEYRAMGTGDGHKHFLTSVDISGEGRYYMVYHGFDEVENPEFDVSTTDYSEIPANGTSALDYWGFFNGRRNGSWYNINGMPTNANITTATKQYLNIQSRMPDYESSMVGMLKILSYPTGGSTSFEYESNDASKYVRCGSDAVDSNYKLSTYFLTLVDQTTTNRVGGVRIKKISDYNTSIGSTPLKTREFFYETEDGRSSGIVLYFPVQTKFYFQQDIIKMSTKQCRLWSPYSLSSNTNSSHIGYSRIVEKNSDNSYIEYKYTDYAEFPDDTSIYKQISSEYYKLIGDTPVDLIKYLRDPVSNEMNRGRLRSKTIYSADNKPVYSEHYSFDVSRRLKYIEDIRHTIATIYQYRILTEPYPLNKKEVVNYMSNGEIKTTYFYEYNSLGQKIKEQVSYGPNGSYHTTYTTYAHELSPGIKKNNLLSIPRQVITTVKKNASDDEMIVEDIKYGYRNYSRSNGEYFYKISEISKAITPQLLTEPRIYYTYVTYNDYDSYGNLLEMTNQQGLKTSYIWGYGGLYPVAIAENASRDRLRSYFYSWQSTVSDLVPIKGCLSESQVNKLRTFPGASIKTFTYKPFIGIETITDTSGRRVEYKYDNNGKLQQIIDDKGNVISEYKYHFIGD